MRTRLGVTGHSAEHGPGGPLQQVRVVELAGLGPVPFAAMLLADLGADVVRVDRIPGLDPGADLGWAQRLDVLARGRRSIAIDLKHPEGVAALRTLIGGADVLIEGFRPGVLERLGIGPVECLERNPRLVYARMTGWGQEGPWAGRAGHDIDYIALAGALHPIGPADRPPPVPLNLIGDFGGGGMLVAFGVVCALLERERSGLGQVVDAAMVDGSATLTALFHGMLAMGRWTEEREANLLDGAAPFYRTYRCADGRFVAVGAIEPSFFAELLRVLGLPHADWPQYERARWPDQAETLAGIFATRTRDEWAHAFEGTDACVAPVLSLSEARHHPHLAARVTLVDQEGLVQPAPAPRFSRTPGRLSRPPVLPGQHTDELLAEAGFSSEDIARLRAQRAVR